ncbi:MAG TPA: GNAT family protein [Bryobacteraceae bacterium]|jgi:RimJ/RimL family protein N-acetyltransferase|nr:GNAT family protein [Bryobacteraceae bacterium]
MIRSSGDDGDVEISPDSTPATRPLRTALNGKLVSLAPLDASAHARDLYESSSGPENEKLWQYLADGPFADYASFRAVIEQKANSDDAVFFAIAENTPGRAAGYASLMRADVANRCVEVGNILYTPRLQQTTAATEAMYLLARHVFEELRYRRYEWKCNARNEPSRRAALRLGFTFEGVFRQHMIVKGRNRDTAWFSMLDREWPARKSAFERWLDPSNFDEAGRQRKTLATLVNEFRLTG